MTRRKMKVNHLEELVAQQEEIQTIMLLRINLVAIVKCSRVKRETSWSERSSSWWNLLIQLKRTSDLMVAIFSTIIVASQVVPCLSMHPRRQAQVATSTFFSSWCISIKCNLWLAFDLSSSLTRNDNWYTKLVWMGTCTFWRPQLLC